ncbi:uncharacterized protein G2W53_019248 [Senna tora]|uniref:Uncharacterized protein n=1 Tax=Senna tora TaxID=362788 RepID=A0A834TUK4_9FABA|nr:uncharacterized protein G2W53_019248 [Senna tora]
MMKRHAVHVRQESAQVIYEFDSFLYPHTNTTQPKMAPTPGMKEK